MCVLAISVDAFVFGQLISLAQKVAEEETIFLVIKGVRGACTLSQRT